MIGLVFGSLIRALWYRLPETFTERMSHIATVLMIALLCLTGAVITGTGVAMLINWWIVE